MKRTSTRWTVAAILVVLILGGVRPDAFAQAARPSQKEPIKIGFIGALSGLVGAVGQDMERGAKVAVEQINAEGGIAGQPVVLLSRDTKANPKVAVEAVRELISQEKVKLFAGVVSSAVALALPQVLEQEDALVITCAAAADVITGANFSRHLFRISDNTYMRDTAAARLMRQLYPDAHKWANLSPDYEYGRSSWAAFEAEMKRIDPQFQVVADQWPKFGALDFKNNIAAVVNAKPQGLFSALYSSDAITMAKQAAPYGLFTDLMVSFNPSNEGDISSGLGKEMHREWGGVHYHPKAVNNGFNARFVEGFKKMFGREPNGYSSETYTALWAYKYAIEKAKGSTDTKTLIAALEGLELDSVTGKRVIRKEDHQAMKDVFFVLFEPDASPQGFRVTTTKIVPGKDVMPPLKK